MLTSQSRSLFEDKLFQTIKLDREEWAVLIFEGTYEPPIEHNVKSECFHL